MYTSLITKIIIELHWLLVVSLQGRDHIFRRPLRLLLHWNLWASSRSPTGASMEEFWTGIPLRWRLLWRDGQPLPPNLTLYWRCLTTSVITPLQSHNFEVWSCILTPWSSCRGVKGLTPQHHAFHRHCCSWEPFQTPISVVSSSSIGPLYNIVWHPRIDSRNWHPVSSCAGDVSFPCDRVLRYCKSAWAILSVSRVAPLLALSSRILLVIRTPASGSVQTTLWLLHPTSWGTRSPHHWSGSFLCQ